MLITHLRIGSLHETHLRAQLGLLVSMMGDQHLMNYPTPQNLNYSWNFGSLAGHVHAKVIRRVYIGMGYVLTIWSKDSINAYAPGLCSYGYLKHEAQLVEHWIPNRKVVGPIVGRPTGLKRPRMPLGLSVLESQSSEPLQNKFDEHATRYWGILRILAAAQTSMHAQS